MVESQNKTQVKFKKALKSNQACALASCFLILLSLFFIVGITFGSLSPGIKSDNVPPMDYISNLNQDVNNPAKSESSYDKQKLQIALGNKREFGSLAVDEFQLCEKNFCVKEGEAVTFSVHCDGTDPTIIVTCIMTDGPQDAEFTSDTGNHAKGTFYFFPKKAGFYKASFQTKVLYCPAYLTECFDNHQIRTAQIQVKPNCGNKQFELYNGDIDLLPFPRIGSIMKGLPAVELWYTATYKDLFSDKRNGEIFWAYTKSDPPELKSKLSKLNTIDCGSLLIIDVNILFPGNPQAQLSPAEIREWYRFTLALANHEMGHVKIIQEGYYGNYDGKWQRKGGFNGIIEKVIGLTPERALEEISKRENQTQQAHDKYDEDTLHGTTKNTKYSPFGPAKLTYPLK